jgi:mRNA interferase RelE/StbE
VSIWKPRRIYLEYPQKENYNDGWKQNVFGELGMVNNLEDIKINMGLSHSVVMAAVKKLKPAEKDLFKESLLAATSPDYLESIKSPARNTNLAKFIAWMGYSTRSNRMRSVFTESTKKNIDKLDSYAREKIKLALIRFLPDPLKHAKKLIHYSLGTNRFRIGDHRVMFDINGQDIVILRAGHRQTIGLGR